MINANAKGEYALYDKGKVIGYAVTDMVDGKKVLAKYRRRYLDLKAAAARDNVLLTLNSGFRTNDEQIALRKKYAPTDKKNDETFILTAKSSLFTPACAPPGWSNHQDGTAGDWKVRDDPNTPQNESLAYAWLVKNAIKFGWIRTVASEKWHWEMREGDQFSVVPKNHPSWEGLV